VESGACKITGNGGTWIRENVENEGSRVEEDQREGEIWKDGILTNLKKQRKVANRPIVEI